MIQRTLKERSTLINACHGIKQKLDQQYWWLLQSQTKTTVKWNKYCKYILFPLHRMEMEIFQDNLFTFHQQVKINMR